MHDTQPQDSIVGRGNRAGADLFRQWFSALTHTAERGDSAAYVFVMGSMCEILRTFNLPVVFPEINSLQMAVRHVAHESLNQAEDYGYSPDICGYVKADVAVQLSGGKHPMGRIPKPSIAVLTNACNTYIKWAEFWDRMYHIPVFTLDIPGTRAAGTQTWPGNPDFENDRQYVQAQISELIALCERVTGIRFDIDRLREVMGHANEMSRGWKKVWSSINVVLLSSTRADRWHHLLGSCKRFRGSRKVDITSQTWSKNGIQADRGIGTLTKKIPPDVHWRPLLSHLPDSMNFSLSGWNLRPPCIFSFSGGANLGLEYDLSRPLESLAEGVLISVRNAMDSMFYQDRAIIEMVDSYHLDGVVYHPVKSCRTTSTGMADNRRSVMAARDIPSLFIESDMMDRRVVGEAQMKNRIDAFFEGLASRRQQEAATH
jgi:benzoyl-CoA reductase subunit B